MQTYGTRAIAAVLATSLCVPAAAMAAATARMSAAFSPERLGGPATVSFAFQIGRPGELSAPLTGFELRYPRGLGLATSGLGLAPCDPAQLEALGPAACPANSQMGYGDALAEIVFGPSLVEEAVQLLMFAAPSPDGYLHLLVYAVGKEPVQAAVLITAELLPGHLAITVPPIPSLPSAPYVAVTHMHLTLGGHLTYYETVRGRRVAYHPAGVGLPATCPRGGFHFSATFTLLDGEKVQSHASVACPGRHR